MREVAVGALVRRYAVQVLLVVLINVPVVSFGLALGWVSLASGDSSGEESGAQAVLAASTTFIASLVAVPVWARALSAGRKPALIATSLAFTVCWALKLAGEGWWVVGARAAAGVGGAGAWSVSPLLAREMCEERFRGAAVAALVPASNLGLLLMYVAADVALPHHTVLWACLALSAAHCCVFLLVPESPAYLAASGQPEQARAALAWVRGKQGSAQRLQDELNALPSAALTVRSPLVLLKEILSSCCRRRTLGVCLVAVVGQEVCGLLTLLQFAERTFLVAAASAVPGDAPPASRLALLLGAVQLGASIIALYLVEKVGRRPLLVVTAFATALCLALGAAGAVSGCTGLAALALAGAVTADSLGLQPVPYALLGDAFEYQWRVCAVVLVSAIASLGNAIEVVVFPAVSAAWGLPAALTLASALTLCYAVWALALVPESRGLSPAELQHQLCPCNQLSGPTKIAASTCNTRETSIKTSHKLDLYRSTPESIIN